MNHSIAGILYQTHRYDLAEAEYRKILAAEPNDALAHAMLAFCLLQRNQLNDATEEARQAIELRPGWDLGYRVMASTLIRRSRFKEAIDPAMQAIQLAPETPENHEVLGGVRLGLRDWQGALDAANEGLAHDAGHTGCLNLRSMALVQLGRRGEAAATMQDALQNNPHNATTHANQGWALLHAGQHRQAMEHFREALRLDPDMRWAKAGMVEAMKARNPIYRVMLRYFLFMSRMNRRAQWAIIIGGYLGMRALNSAAQDNPELSPYVLPILLTYLAFALMTWVAAPLFNLLLRIDRFGRYALSPDQTSASNWIGLSILLSLICFAAGLMLGKSDLFIGAVMLAALMLPLSAIFILDRGWPRWAMSALAVADGLVAIAFIACQFALFHAASGEIADNLLQAFIYMMIAGMWGGNMLVMTRVKR